MHLFRLIPIRVITLIACMGAMLSVLADIYSGYSSGIHVSSFSLTFLDVKQFGLAKSLRHLEIGQCIAFISFPLSCLSIIPIYQGIKNSKFKILKNIFVLSFILSFVLGLAFHSLITYISCAFVKEQQGLLVLSQSEIDNMANLFEVILKASVLSSLVSFACFSVIVFRSSTIFSKIAVIFNPLLLAVIIIVVSLNVPAPLAPFLYIVAGNLGVLIWYTLLFKPLVIRDQNTTVSQNIFASTVNLSN